MSRYGANDARARDAARLRSGQVVLGMLAPLTDPAAALDALGAVWSPDFDAYASGELDISQVRCVLCGLAPCQCRQCEATQENRFYQITGRPELEPCGMTIDPATGECPRGHGRAGGAR